MHGAGISPARLLEITKGSLDAAVEDDQPRLEALMGELMTQGVPMDHLAWTMALIATACQHQPPLKPGDVGVPAVGRPQPDGRIRFVPAAEDPDVTPGQLLAVRLMAAWRNDDRDTAAGLWSGLANRIHDGDEEAEDEMTEAMLIVLGMASTFVRGLNDASRAHEEGRCACFRD